MIMLNMIANNNAKFHYALIDLYLERIKVKLIDVERKICSLV
jgi:hypothetical protein